MIGVIIGIIVFLIIRSCLKESEQERQQKQFEERQKAYENALNTAEEEYNRALNGKDKRDALQKGRIYYALLRNGISALTYDYTNELSRRDEERISLDLRSMNC